MTYPGASGQDESMRPLEVERAGRRAMIGWDELPVISVPAPDAASAAVFPRREVLKRDVDGGSATVRRVGYIVVCLVLGTLATFPSLMNVASGLATIGLPHMARADSLLTVALLVLLTFILVIDFTTSATWEIYPLGGAYALVVEVASVHTSVRDLIFILLSTGILTRVVRKSRIAKRVRWRRLGQVVDNHRLVEADVVRDAWSNSSGGVHMLRLVLASEEISGVQWRVQLSFSTGDDMEAAPTAGDRMLLFVCPADPEVVVARPVQP